ncbi:uncharacterized protein NECHADRAFT_61450 [Fusarium vanettenii 77-13-4]|uniref:DUF7053 domain-containing protein n=1 Tax=Fusarium vanettenii (strain ATCC MYA-4622 / CBS 123669 / FGSC 9596 / NRRL 45880 / 77-13-4) TaxID=660122 RepID=C7YSP3_FUSV7|nr:uncharacterized protein NECHADRAFT_61450 [Fusarium vanettenii 77-13-4]EEU45676.1 hypothetical protein NECHADRAFT_61450 [Fusarium vanettenii 77-13-4]
MRSQYRFFISIPIPNTLPPEIVLNFIQTYTPTLQSNPVIADFTEKPTDINGITSDPFFGPPDNTLRTFEIHEVITLAPGLRKETRWPTVFQCTPHGIRSRANATAGIVVWAEWVVRPRQDSSSAGSPIEAGNTPSTERTLGEEWELYEEVTIEANRLVMPFVSRTSNDVHREICHKVLAEAMKGYVN